MTALQLLPPRQRAVLILRDVLGYRANEVAAMLEVTQESVTSALKRARATLATQLASQPGRLAPPAPESAEERRLVARFVDAFGARDVDGIVALLTEDAWVKMPPMPFEYQGREDATRFFAAVLPPGGHDYRFVRTRANGQPACAFYVRDPATGMGRTLGLLVLTLAGDLISEVIRFDASVLGSFGLPRSLPNPPGCPGACRNPRSEFAADGKGATAAKAECSQEACRRRLLARCTDRAGVCGDGAG